MNLLIGKELLSDEELDEFKKEVFDNRKYIHKLDDITNEYFDKNFEELVKLRPKELVKFVEQFESRGAGIRKQIISKYKQVSWTEENKSDGKHHANYIVDTLYSNMPEEAKKKVYTNAGVSVCPYCNRNFVDIIEVDTDGNYCGRTYEMDHFFSKSKYPMLAVSFYNLIPVCPACNRIKGDKELSFYPYDNDNYDKDGIVFSYNIKSASLVDEGSLDIVVKSKNEAMSNDVQILYLDELYQAHRDVALEVIQKAQCQSKGYLDGLTTQLEKLFPTKKDSYRLVYGNYFDVEDWNKRPLSKMTYDIAKETLGYYGIDLDELYAD